MDLTDAEIEARNNRLSQKEHVGAIMRDFCRHSGFKILQDMIQEKIADKRNAWLKASPQEAEAIRLQVQPWNEITDMLKKLIIEGDAANIARRGQNQE